MATVKTLGDVITGIQNQSKPGVTYSVALQASGAYNVLRNGLLTWQFLFRAVPGGGDLTGAGTDANPTGALIQLFSPDGTTSKADAQQFISSLT